MRLAKIALCLVSGLACASSSSLLSEADRHLEDRELGRATARYREVAEKECATGDQALCCDALRGQAEALHQADERQDALRAWRRAAGQCPMDLAVRRRLFQAEHVGEAESPAAPSTVAYAIEAQVAALGARVKLTWVGLFLDGELATREPVALKPGPHALDAEIFFEVPERDRAPRRMRLSASKSVTVPTGGATTVLTGKVRLVLAERSATMPEERYTLTLEGGEVAPAAAPTAPAGKQPGVLEQILAEHLGMSMRTEGSPPRVPRELLRAGEGWKIPAELCVTPQGRVDLIRLLQPGAGRDPRVDAAILEAVRRWSYGQYVLNGVPQPFCHALIIDLAGR
jgi:hypothetical protein